MTYREIKTQLILEHGKKGINLTDARKTLGFKKVNYTGMVLANMYRLGYLNRISRNQAFIYYAGIK